MWTKACKLTAFWLIQCIEHLCLNAVNCRLRLLGKNGFKISYVLGNTAFKIILFLDKQYPS